MTQRLYYHDSYLCHFSARLLGLNEISGGWIAELDRSAFYPTSGGQPHDLGTIGGVDVWNVIEDEQDHILHWLREPLRQEGEIHCAIDWFRRFDHMQQHSGQHVLSQAFIRAARLDTLSFHMGVDYATIDLAAENVSPVQVRQAEELANVIVCENRPIRVRTVSREESLSIDLRKETTREGPLRIVEVQEFDISACGGTHVRMTGEIGGIFVRKLERVNRQVRVTFVSGRRAVQASRNDSELLESVARRLSVGIAEVPKRIENQVAENRQLRKVLQEKNKRLVRFQSNELFNNTPARSGFRIIKKIFEGEEFDFVKQLAQSLVTCGSCVALLGNRNEQAQVVFAASESLNLDLRPLMAECCKLLEGKGGGARTLVQGGGKNNSNLQAALDWVESQIRFQSSPPIDSNPD